MANQTARERKQLREYNRFYLTLMMLPSGCFCRYAFTTQAVCSRYVMTRLRNKQRSVWKGVEGGTARAPASPGRTGSYHSLRAILLSKTRMEPSPSPATMSERWESQERLVTQLSAPVGMSCGEGTHNPGSSYH